MVLRGVFFYFTLLAACGSSSAQYQNYNYSGYSTYSPYQCGTVRCTPTVIQCDGCQVPNGFDRLVTRSRSILWRGEELLKAVGKLFIDQIQRFIKGNIDIPLDFAGMVIQDGQLLIQDITTMIANFNEFVADDVIGRIVTDIVKDLQDMVNVVRKTLDWIKSWFGGDQIQPPSTEIVWRCQQTKIWNPDCQGWWPCTVIFPNPSPTYYPPTYAPPTYYPPTYAPPTYYPPTYDVCTCQVACPCTQYGASRSSNRLGMKSSGARSINPKNNAFADSKLKRLSKKSG